MLRFVVSSGCTPRLPVHIARSNYYGGSRSPRLVVASSPPSFLRSAFSSSPGPQFASALQAFAPLSSDDDSSSSTSSPSPPSSSSSSSSSSLRQQPLSDRRAEYHTAAAYRSPPHGAVAPSEKTMSSSRDDIKHFYNTTYKSALSKQHGRPSPWSAAGRRDFSTSPPTPPDSSGSNGASKSSSTSSHSNNPTPAVARVSAALSAGMKACVSASTSISAFLISLPGQIFWWLTHPVELRQKLAELWKAAKDEAHHYWLGSKLMVAETKVAWSILQRALGGSTLTRRERKHLVRSAADLFRLVPFSVFVIVPFAEFTLPFFLKVFPNMLPSTFQDKLKVEEDMKRDLKLRVSMAGFFQETLQELANERKKLAKKKLEEDGKSESKEVVGAEEFLDFLEKAKAGEPLPASSVIKFASLFRDDLTLDNMKRMQLQSLCKYMQIAPYGSDGFLRFQLRFKVKALKEDDRRIIWEGIDSLTKTELQEACSERGMRATGLTAKSYKNALQQWLDLSVNQNVPISLLIMSRTFFLRDEVGDHLAAGPVRPAEAGMDAGAASKADKDKGEKQALSGLAEAISGLEKTVVNEVLLGVATADERRSNPEVIKVSLEVLESQNAKIKEENEARKKVEERGKASKAEAEKKAKEEATAAKKAEEEAVKRTASDNLSADPEATPAVSSAAAPNTPLSSSGGGAGAAALAAATSAASAVANAAAAGVNFTAAAAAAVVSAVTPAKAEAPKEDAEKAEDEAAMALGTPLGETPAPSAAPSKEAPKELSPSEIDALEQLIRPNPVDSEKSELERIKLAVATTNEEIKIVEEIEESNKMDDAAELLSEKLANDAKEEKKAADVVATALKVESDKKELKDLHQAVADGVSGSEDKLASRIIKDEESAAAAVVFEQDQKAKALIEGEAKMAEAALAGTTVAAAAAAAKVEEEVSAKKEAVLEATTQKLDKSIDDLQAKIDSMLSGLESKIDKVEKAIGDKMHLLDKDRDGILSSEEMLSVLQSVIKKKLSHKEMMEILKQLDTNHDGLFTVNELLDWIELKKLTSAVERDGDVKAFFEKISPADGGVATDTVPELAVSTDANTIDTANSRNDKITFK